MNDESSFENSSAQRPLRRTALVAGAALIGVLGLVGFARFRADAVFHRLLLPAASTARIGLDADLGSQYVSLDDFVARPDLEPMPWDEAEANALRLVERLTTRERYSLLRGGGNGGPGYYVGNVEPAGRHGIPALKMQDAGSGFRPTDPGEAGTTTQWPCMLAIAAAWDEDLMSKVAGAIAREFRGKGANVLLGPGVEVHRAARGGRNFEYVSGEDPYLGSRLAKVYVTAVQAEGVMAVAKHFAFNEQETARMSESSDVDERTAWELYYPPFEAAVEAGVGAIMCSYNKVNGSYACENEGTLQRDLRERMGFRGFVMSDWDATHSTSAIEKGLDMELPKSKWFSDSRLSDEASSASIRQAAVHVLTSIYRLRLDKNPGCKLPCHDRHKSNQRSPEHLELARIAATKSITMLQNNGVLPLRPNTVRKIAVLGKAADAQDINNMWSASPYVGGGSGHVIAPILVTPLAGIRERAAADGIEVVHYAGSTLRRIRQTVRDADVVIVVAAALSGEATDRRQLSLDDGADALINAVAKMRPTVVLMQTPAAVLTTWRTKTSAILNLFYGGEQTGKAWASILFGDDTPAGKLPVTFPASVEDTIEPGLNPHVQYTEGIFTSYRSPEVVAAFPFGHGLSYTHFSFSGPSISRDCTGVSCISVRITNTGQAPGAEVAQAYFRFTQADREPRLVLRGFQRTHVLESGEAQDVIFSFTSRDLSIYHVGSGWVRQDDVQVHIGASSADIRHVIPLRVPAALVA